MKNNKAKKIVAIVFATIMVFAMATTAMAAPSTTSLSCNYCGTYNTAYVKSGTARHYDYSITQHSYMADYSFYCRNGSCGKLNTITIIGGLENHSWSWVTNTSLKRCLQCDIVVTM